MQTDGPNAVPGFAFDERFPLELPQWAALAIAAHDWVQLRDLVVDRCTQVIFAKNRHDPTFIEAFSGSVEENVESLRGILCGELDPDDVPLANRMRFASLQAELRIPQAAFQRSYRISFFLQWQEWANIVAASAEASNVSRVDAVAAQTSLSSLVHAYSDSVVSSVALSFARSEEAFNRSRTHVRQRLVRELLEGNDDALSPADMLTLDYSLECWHLALQLPHTPQGAASQLAVGLRGAVRQTHTIVYPLRLESSVIWLASSSRWSEERIARVVDVLETAGVVASMSDPAQGLDGFLEAFRQVGQVNEVRSTGGRPDGRVVVRYSELRLEILLLQNHELATRFVADELGALAEDTSEAAKLRATLEASFRLGSHVAAAEYLQLHEHTVRNRLQKAQDLLGPLHDRRTELQVALRLWRLLARA